MLRWLKTLADTLWLSLWRPRTPRAPTADQLVVQPWGTAWCGPAVAVTLERILTGRPGDLAAAKAALLGTFPGGQTSVEALAAWLRAHGMHAAMMLAPIGGGLFESVRQAVQGGSYCAVLIFTNGSREPDASGSPPTHFVICYGVDGARLLFVDSLDRGAVIGGHFWSVERRALADRWAAQVGRFGPVEFTPFVVVRRVDA